MKRTISPRVCMQTLMPTVSLFIMASLPTPGWQPAAAGTHPFSSSQIALSGSAGVHQGQYPDCWFEASLAALAQSPRGQKIISNMIVQDGNSTYTVIFPGDQKHAFKVPFRGDRKYSITVIQEARSRASEGSSRPDRNVDGRVCNNAQWADIIESAGRQEFPDNDAADDPARGRPKIRTGLSMLSGKQANAVLLDGARAGQIEEIIAHCISARSPAVISTKASTEAGSCPSTVCLLASHAYSLIAYNRSTQTVTLQNPLGDSVERQFANQAEIDIANGNEPDCDACPLPLAGQERNGVKNLGNGILQVRLSTLKQCGKYIAWADL